MMTTADIANIHSQEELDAAFDAIVARYARAYTALAFARHEIELERRSMIFAKITLAAAALALVGACWG